MRWIKAYWCWQVDKEGSVFGAGMAIALQLTFLFLVLAVVPFALTWGLDGVVAAFFPMLVWGAFFCIALVCYFIFEVWKSLRNVKGYVSEYLDKDC